MDYEVKGIVKLDPITYNNNCENCIGGVVVPLGLAGPIVINSKEFKVPLATTEAALVASVNRGCKVLRECGVKTDSRKIGITRAPVFDFLGEVQSEDYYSDWIIKHKNELKKIISKESKHTSLLRADVKIYNNRLFVKFHFDTDEAMGMNMATIATDAIVPFFERELNLKLVALSSNFCSDKKVSLVNIEEGRGFFAKAETIISKNIFEDILKTSIEDFIKVYEAKIIDGSELAKAVGQNAHIANVIAGIFVATGQDAAHIGEASIGNTNIEKISDTEIKISVELNNLVCGFVGGGVGLPSQSEAMQLTQCKNLTEFVELIAAACLAGEISLLASLAENSLACVHKKFRNKDE